MTLKKKIISCMMAGILAFSCSVPVSATNIDEAERKARQLKKEKDAAEAEKKSLSSQLEKIVADMELSEKKMTDKEAEIAGAEEDLVVAKTEENRQYESMKKRIRYIYESGNTGFVEVLLEAKNLSDFLNKAEYITKLSKYDRDMLEEFKRLVKEVEKKEKQLKKEYEELEVLQKELVANQAKVETLLKEKSSELATIESEMGKVQTLIAEAKEAERKRQEALAAQQAAAAAAAKPKPAPPAQTEKPSGGSSGGSGSAGSSGGSVESGSGMFTHPCPGSRQTSYFGEVRQGIGDTRPHKGIDYAAPAGTPIYAAAGGKVLIAGYSPSAGNWVVISHGNGLITKYMHMYAAPYVSAGQTVSRGQNIGGVGTTGQSTGNHLHFQAELNGVPVNPANYM